MRCRLFSSILSLCLPDANSKPSCRSCDNQKWLQTMPNVTRGAIVPRLRLWLQGMYLFKSKSWWFRKRAIQCVGHFRTSHRKASPLYVTNAVRPGGQEPVYQCAAGSLRRALAPAKRHRRERRVYGQSWLPLVHVVKKSLNCGGGELGMRK